ncbi:MAG: enoyl-CoA hydratase/isomerase family protein [Bacteroidales bacterium]|nr:enoyl-CoA hydratase/isomerase family protein [Bacteroidales bacterium]
MTLQWRIEDNIGWLAINQPPANTMSLEFFRDFQEAIQIVEHTDGLKALIIHANGRHFSSGANLDELLDHVDEEMMLQHYNAFLHLEQLGIPAISAIRGVCLGSAMELTLFCHFRICSNEAVFGFPETTYNLMPGIGGVKRFSKLVGKAKALELILHGNTFSAREAFEFGLIDAIVPKHELLTFAARFAKTLPLNITGTDRRICLQKYLNPLNAKINL